MVNKEDILFIDIIPTLNLSSNKIYRGGCHGNKTEKCR